MVGITRQQWGTIGAVDQVVFMPEAIDICQANVWRTNSEKGGYPHAVSEAGKWKKVSSFMFMLYLFCTNPFSWAFAMLPTHIPGLILGLRPANERRRYKLTPFLIGWVQS